jgi:hypothetical protein
MAAPGQQGLDAKRKADRLDVEDPTEGVDVLSLKKPCSEVQEAIVVRRSRRASVDAGSLKSARASVQRAEARKVDGAHERKTRSAELFDALPPRLRSLNSIFAFFAPHDEPLSREEFRQALMAHARGHRQGRAAPEAAIDDLFDESDVLGTGSVLREHFMRWVLHEGLSRSCRFVTDFVARHLQRQRRCRGELVGVDVDEDSEDAVRSFDVDVLGGAIRALGWELPPPAVLQKLLDSLDLTGGSDTLTRLSKQLVPGVALRHLHEGGALAAESAFAAVPPHTCRDIPVVVHVQPVSVTGKQRPRRVQLKDVRLDSDGVEDRVDARLPSLNPAAVAAVGTTPPAHCLHPLPEHGPSALNTEAQLTNKRGRGEVPGPRSRGMPPPGGMHEPRMSSDANPPKPARESSERSQRQALPGIPPKAARERVRAPPLPARRGLFSLAARETQAVRPREVSMRSFVVVDAMVERSLQDEKREEAAIRLELHAPSERQSRLLATGALPKYPFSLPPTTLLKPSSASVTLARHPLWTQQLQADVLDSRARPSQPSRSRVRSL